MGKKKKNRASLEEILASTSDVLFPAELGEQVVDINSTDCDGDTPLHVMAWRKDRYGVELLIEHGANVNAVGDMGNTPLHVALSQKEIYIVEVLLKAKASTSIKSEFGETAKEKAAKLGGKYASLFKEYEIT